MGCTTLFNLLLPQMLTTFLLLYSIKYPLIKQSTLFRPVKNVNLSRGGCTLASGGACSYNLHKFALQIFLALGGAPAPTVPPGYAYDPLV